MTYKAKTDLLNERYYIVMGPLLMMSILFLRTEFWPVSVFLLLFGAYATVLKLRQHFGQRRSDVERR